MQPYLVTNTSHGRYTRLKRLQDDITAAELLLHFPHNKSSLCIVEWEHYRQAEKFVQKGKAPVKLRLKEEEKNELFSRPSTVEQKRSRSITKV